MPSAAEDKRARVVHIATQCGLLSTSVNQLQQLTEISTLQMAQIKRLAILHTALFSSAQELFPKQSQEEESEEE